MLEYIAILIVAGFVYESISWFFRVRTSAAWLRKERGEPLSVSATKGKTYVLLPVLYEEDILEETVAYFNSCFIEHEQDIYLVIVTTEKERPADNHRHSTIDLAQRIAAAHRHIIHIHYPEREGKMAHQLNFAVDYLAEKGMLADDDLIAVYNADSRPEKETFRWVRHMFNEGKSAVFQQYGCYLGNIQHIQDGPTPCTLSSAAAWQTRWAIGFEIYNALKQFRFRRGIGDYTFNYPLNYCIGHGLFITRKILRQAGGFNEGMHNEDAILGLYLSDAQELIMPVPYFDVSESPDTVSMLYTQKANWYFGPLQAYAYANIIRAYTAHGLWRTLRLFFLATKLFFHAVYWIVGPTLAIASCILAVLSHSPAVLIVATIISIFLFAVPNNMSHALMTDLGVVRLPSFRSHVVQMFSGFILFYILHGASAYKGLYKYLRHVLFKKSIVKEKTVIKRG